MKLFGEMSRYKEWKNEIRRIASLWAEVRRYSADWGADSQQVTARREEAERRAYRLRLLVSEVRRMKPENKAKWYAEIDAAALEPQPKVRAARKPTTPAQRTEAIAAENRLPLWHGPNGDWPAPRRVVGVSWCSKLGRWAIRFSTRLGEYVNTNTHGLTPAELADEVDRIKAHLVFRGHLDGRARVGAWNDKTAIAFNLKVLEAQQGDALDSDDSLGIAEPLYAHLVCWLKDQSEYAKHCMEATRAGRLPDTFKRFPKQSWYDARMKRMTSLSSKEAAKFAEALSNAPNAS
jgi:uncharacterized small protein (DUF1192 family)